MWNDTAEAVGSPYRTIKVHSSMCFELKKLIARISPILPAIESARPWCRDGIQALCSLQHAIDKAKLFIRHCSGSSTIFLAIMADSMVLRCEKIQNTWKFCLSQLQNMVPCPLAEEIYRIIDVLNSSIFNVDPNDEEAGKIMLFVLRKNIVASEPMNKQEVEDLQLAALKLHLTSPLALLIEKRSIISLLSKIRDENPTKKMLTAILHLLKRYRKSILPQAGNTALSSCSSMSSFGSYLNGCSLSISNLSGCSSDSDCYSNSSDFKLDNGLDCELTRGFHKSQSFTNGHDMILGFLSNLAALPWESQCRIMEDIKTQLKENNEVCCSTVSHIKPMLKFLENASNFSNVKGQRDGAQVLLELLSKSSEMPPVYEEEIHLLVSFLDSDISEEALSITEFFSRETCNSSRIVAYGILPSIFQILDSKSSEHHIISLKILCNLSSNDDTCHHIVYLNLISKLVRFLGNPILMGYSIEVIKNLCNIEEGRSAVIEATEFMSYITELLGNSSKKNQEHAVNVLLSLCHQEARFCKLVMEESIVQSLVTISVNGNTIAKTLALELLRVLRDSSDHNMRRISVINLDLNLDRVSNPQNCRKRMKVWRVSIFSKFSCYIYWKRYSTG